MLELSHYGNPPTALIANDDEDGDHGDHGDNGDDGNDDDDYSICH